MSSTAVIGGQPYAYSFQPFTRGAPSYVEYPLKGLCTELRTTYAMHDSAAEGSSSRITLALDGVTTVDQVLVKGQVVASTTDVSGALVLRYDLFSNADPASYPAVVIPEVSAPSDSRQGAAFRHRSHPRRSVVPCGEHRLRRRDQAAPGDHEDHRPGARPGRHAREIADLGEQVAAPDLWDDVESATRVTGRLSALQGELDKFTGLDSRIEDLGLMVEMAQEEGDAAAWRTPSASSRGSRSPSSPSRSAPCSTASTTPARRW